MSLSIGKAGKKKRTRGNNEDFVSKQSTCEDDDGMRDSDLQSVVGPFHGVIACLSGLARDKKEDLHRIILSLGGR